MYGKSQEDKTDDRKVWHDVKAKNNKTKQNYTYGFPELEITFRGRPH